MFIRERHFLGHADKYRPGSYRRLPSASAIETLHLQHRRHEPRTFRAPTSSHVDGMNSLCRELPSMVFRNITDIG